MGGGGFVLCLDHLGPWPKGSKRTRAEPEFESLHLSVASRRIRAAPFALGLRMAGCGLVWLHHACLVYDRHHIARFFHAIWSLAAGRVICFSAHPFDWAGIPFQLVAIQLR